MKNEIMQKGICQIKIGQYEYLISRQLIKDGKNNKVLKNKIKSKICVTMLHGQKDEVVPTIYSRKVLKIFSNAKKKLIVVKNGDHSLSTKKNLKILLREIEKN